MRKSRVVGDKKLKAARHGGECKIGRAHAALPAVCNRAHWLMTGAVIVPRAVARGGRTLAGLDGRSAGHSGRVGRNHHEHEQNDKTLAHRKQWVPANGTTSAAHAQPRSRVSATIQCRCLSVETPPRGRGACGDRGLFSNHDPVDFYRSHNRNLAKLFLSPRQILFV